MLHVAATGRQNADSGVPEPGQSTGAPSISLPFSATWCLLLIPGAIILDLGLPIVLSSRLIIVFYSFVVAMLTMMPPSLPGTSPNAVPHILLLLLILALYCPKALPLQQAVALIAPSNTITAHTIKYQHNDVNMLPCFNTGSECHIPNARFCTP